MIPILFEASETEFKTNGLGRLSDAISCTVTEERNGSFELEMEYPIDGIHYSDITYQRLIYAKPSEGRTPQPFEIYLITRPLDGKVKIEAEHISYRLKYIPVTTFTANGVVDALSGLKSHAVCDCPFTLETDKSNAGEFKVETPAGIRGLLADGDDTIQGIFGGEWLFDKFNAKLCSQRGTDSGVLLAYGKNLTSLEQEENIEEMYTGIYPYLSTDDGLITLPEKIITLKEDAPYDRITAVDFSDNLQDTEITRTYYETTVDTSTSRVHTEEKTETITVHPTADSLREQANLYIKENQLDAPKVSLKVGFTEIGKSAGYEDISALEHVELCDTVTVQYVKLGVSATAKVTQTEFDVLTERYKSIDIGDEKATLNDLVQNSVRTAKVNASSSGGSGTGTAITEIQDELNKTKSGSKTLTLTDTKEATLFTMTELDTLFSLSSGTCTNKNTLVTAVNADETITTPITGCRYSSSGWIVVFSESVNGSVLVNYTAQYIG